MNIAFDIGGVLSKHPEIFRRVIRAFTNSAEINVWIITDMHDREHTLKMLDDNGFGFVDDHRVLNADYKTYGEACKAVLCEEHGISILIDDFPGYLAMPGTPPVRLQIMPDPFEPYYHRSWKTDGTEGDFGRHAAPPPGLWRCPICGAKKNESCDAGLHG